MDANSSEIFTLAWAPSTGVVVGDITSKVHNSANGVNLVAEDQGVRLFADILNGNAIDYSAYEDGSELGVVTFIEPAGNPPPDGGVPAGNPPPPGVLAPPGVLGVGRCHYVCVSVYGGYRCWRKC
jgi:hypothetical protein